MALFQNIFIFHTRTVVSFGGGSDGELIVEIMNLEKPVHHFPKITVFPISNQERFLNLSSQNMKTNIMSRWENSIVRILEFANQSFKNTKKRDLP